MVHPDIIVIGCSLGGVEALPNLVAAGRHVIGVLLKLRPSPAANA
jgi:hypothetical protein